MTIRHLKIFLAVAETGKMSRAAQKLYITQPSVSQAIRELEEYYQVLLFERISKRLHITEHGQRLYGYARQAVAQFDLLEENMKKNVKEKLRIGATVSVCKGVLPCLVYQFRKEYPDIEIYSCEGNSRAIEQKLLNMELDVGIIEGKVKSRELISIPMIDDFMVLACGQQHPFANKEILHVEELQGEEFAMRERGSGSRELFEEYLQRHHIRIKTVFEENTPEALISAVKIVGCLSVLSVRLIEQEIRRKEICIFQQAEKEWNRCFSFVYHKDKFVTKGMKAMEEITRAYGKNSRLEEIRARLLVN